jgi:hypothetical protein
METSVEQLIKDRTFASLTAEELESVKDLCANEEEFQTMKRFFQELDAVSASRKTIINPEVKNSLDGIFSAKHPGIRANWTAPETVAAPAAPIIPLHQRTWVRVAAIAVLVLGTAPFWGMLKTDVPAKDRTMTAQIKSGDKDKSVQSVEPMETTDATPVEEQRTDIQTSAAGGIPEPDAMLASAEPVLAEETVTTYLWTAPADKFSTFELKDSEVTLSGTYSTTVSPSVSSLGFATAVPPMSGGYLKSVDTDTKGLVSFGRNADLDPNGKFDENRERSITCSLADQPEDLLDLLVPAF